MSPKCDKWKARGATFFVNASHAWRTPMTGLQGYLEMMTDDSLDLHIRQRAVQSMQDQSRCMERLVAQLLKLSHIEAAPQGETPRPVDMPFLAQTFAGQRQRG